MSANGSLEPLTTTASRLLCGSHSLKIEEGHHSLSKLTPLEE